MGEFTPPDTPMGVVGRRRRRLVVVVALVGGREVLRRRSSHAPRVLLFAARSSRP